ncbi:protein TBATA-like [Chiloscyllium plagiosum]|uniref:protein TBATA-like n=1 Tax=Chiloscyllium plagiosum TaxID=36176 RepID=UPI001CB7D191|nr:protein TBATA-like [Chiloscyllium plagiosum]
MMPPTDPQEGSHRYISDNALRNESPTARNRAWQAPHYSLGNNIPHPGNNNCKQAIPADHFFYSRNNPHPKRVYHIRGLNDAPVCKVDDFVACSKEPSKPPTPKQEYIKPMRPITANIPITAPYPAHIITGVPQPPCKDEAQPDIGLLYSQAWRDELRDLTARVEFIPEQTSEAKEEENAKWATQSPAERGILCTSPIRPKSRPASRLGSHAGTSECTRPTVTVAEREVLVLELLSQILQTDSLQAVQQWLLITGQKG